MYGKTCNLPFEIEHRAYWALRSCNPDLKIAGEKRFLQLHDLDELRLQAYENSKLYKARTKAYHDKKLRIRKEFKVGDKVLLFNMKYKFKAPKLKPKWFGPYIVKHGFPSGDVELYDKHGGSFIVNGHRIKLYYDTEQLNVISDEGMPLDDDYEAITFMAPHKEMVPWGHTTGFIYDALPRAWEKVTLEDIDETGKGIVIGNVLYIPKKNFKVDPP